jgi:hypothetical protein
MTRLDNGIGLVARLQWVKSKVLLVRIKSQPDIGPVYHLQSIVRQDLEGHCMLTEITQPCIHTCDGLFIRQLYSLPDLLEETECKEDMPLTLPFASFVSPLTVDNSDMN